MHYEFGLFFNKEVVVMPTVSVTWADAALEAIRTLGQSSDPVDLARVGPPMAARSLAILHTAIYDA